MNSEILISKKVDYDNYNINNITKIFPMLDYIGVSVIDDYNIFKSQYDLNFYKKYLKK